jgi:cytochrome bd-type quinol oxidase subunit 1
MSYQEQHEEKSSKDLIIGMLLAMAAIAGSILLMSAPLEKLMGESVYGLRSAFHGLFAGIFMVTMTIGLYQAFRLWSGAPLNIRELEVGSALNAIACFLTILFGNWVYIPYRAAGGPRSFFLEKAPEIHKIFFEFKEFVALFTLPLAVAAAYVILRYGERLNGNKQLREAVALLLVLAFFYFVAAFGLGAAVTKLKSV